MLSLPISSFLKRSACLFLRGGALALARSPVSPRLSLRLYPSLAPAFSLMCDLESTSLRFLRRHYALPSYPSHPRAYEPVRSFSLPPSLALFLATPDACPAPLQPTLADRELPLSLLSTLGRAACSDARRAASCCPNSSPPRPFSPPGARAT